MICRYSGTRQHLEKPRNAVVVAFGHPIQIVNPVTESADRRPRAQRVRMELSIPLGVRDNRLGCGTMGIEPEVPEIGLR